MRKNKPENFSQIVCNPASMRDVFDLHRPTNAWWRLILALHGKPVQLTLSVEQKTERVADGFRFYASLYRGLGIMFLLLAPTLALLPIAESGSFSTYVALSSLLAGLYLWAISGLGYAGANSYRAGEQHESAVLIAFMVMIVAFLSLFVAAISVASQYSSSLPATLNLAAIGILFVFGIGSYMIEILYLATEQRT